MTRKNKETKKRPQGPITEAEFLRRKIQAERDRQNLLRSIRDQRPVTLRKKKSKNSKPAIASALARSILNPFQWGACIPDGAKGVGCFICKGSLGYLTGTGGTALNFALNLDPVNLIFGYNGSTTSTWSFPSGSTWTSSSKLSLIAGNYARYRPISAGIRVYFVGATNTDQGNLYVVQFPGSTTPYGLNGTNSANTPWNDYAQWSQSCALRDGACITWRPEDPEDYQFNDLTAAPVNLNVEAPSKTPWLGVLVDGAQPASGCIRVEYWVNFEGQAQGTNYIQGSRTAAAKKAEAGWFEKAMNAIDGVSPFAKLAIPAAIAWYAT